MFFKPIGQKTVTFVEAFLGRYTVVQRIVSGVKAWPH